MTWHIVHLDGRLFVTSWFIEQMRQDAHEAGASAEWIDGNWGRGYLISPPVIPYKAPASMREGGPQYLGALEA